MEWIAVPSRISDGEGNPRTSEYIEEGRARLAGRPVETPGRAVDVDEVDLDQGRIEKLCKRAGIRRRLVDVSQEDVFNEDALPSRPRMIVDGRDQIGARVHALDGHERGPFVGDSVGERYREAELVPLARVAADGGDHARGGDGDGPSVDGAARWMAEDARRLHHRVVVEERLAHSHEHDAAHGPVGFLADREDLADDLVCGEIAFEAQRAGGAERARKRATRLARDADDVLLLLALVGARVDTRRLARHRDAHRFDLRAVVQFEQILHEAVPRLVPAIDAERLCARAARHPLEDLAAQAANAGEIRLVALHGCGEKLAARRLVEIEGAVIVRQHSAAVHHQTISIALSSSKVDSSSGAGFDSAGFAGSGRFFARGAAATAGLGGGSGASFPSTSCEVSATSSTTYGFGR